jgi:hypothetical protein
MAVISFWSLSASAANWQVIADTKLGQLQLDKANVSTEGKLTRAVLLYAFKDLQRQSATPFAVFNKRQDDILVDCSSPSLAIRTSRFFEDDKLVSSFELKAEEIKFKQSAPGTMVETVVNAVCGATSK